MDRGPSDRQATWVALRTLRQRPAVVGRTDDGRTVYEIRSIRLVLSPGATHFNRLVTCARCGREVPGSSVLGPADLDGPPISVFCERCVRSPVRPRPDRAQESEGAPPPEPPPAREPDHGRRLATMEAELERVAEAVRVQNAELAKMAAELAEGLDSLRAEMASLQRQRQEEREEVVALMEAQRTELTELLHEVASETLTSVGEPLRDLTTAREDFERRLQSLQGKADEDRRRVEAGRADRRPPGALLASFEQQLREAEERLRQL